MTERVDYIRGFSAIAGTPHSRDEQKRIVQALASVATTAAHAMSRNSVGFSSILIEETTVELLTILEKRFDIELGE